MWVTGAEVAVGAAAVVAALAPPLAVLLQALVVALACAQEAEAVHNIQSGLDDTLRRGRRHELSRPCLSTFKRFKDHFSMEVHITEGSRWNKIIS